MHIHNKVNVGMSSVRAWVQLMEEALAVLWIWKPWLSSIWPKNEAVMITHSRHQSNELGTTASSGYPTCTHTTD